MSTEKIRNEIITLKKRCDTLLEILDENIDKECTIEIKHILKDLEIKMAICNYIDFVKTNPRKLTKADIARFFNVSRESIRQIVDSSYRKLRKKMTMTNFKEKYDSSV